MKSYKFLDESSNRMLGGIVILLAGIVFLLNNFGLHFPNWLFSWSSILLVIGLLIGAKRNFTGSKWLIMVWIGTYFTFFDMIDISSSDYFFPFAFISLGLYLLFKQSFQHKFNIK